MKYLTTENIFFTGIVSGLMGWLTSNPPATSAMRALVEVHPIATAIGDIVGITMITIVFLLIIKLIYITGIAFFDKYITNKQSCGE